MALSIFSSLTRRIKINSEKLLAKESFARNLAFAFSGNATAQILGFAFTPVVTRIFSPAQYGLFALFISVASNLSSLSTLQLPTGFVTAKSKSDLKNLVQLSLISLVIFTTLVTLSIVIFKEQLFTAFDMGGLGVAIYLIPIQVFFMGLDYTLLGWNVCLKEFARGAWGRVISVVVGKGSTVAWGVWIGPHSLGLILGNLLISCIDSAVKLSRSIRVEFRALADVDWKNLKTTLQSYSSYPLLVTPGIIIVGVSQQLPLYFFSHHFSPEWAGYYALASTVVMMPLQMIITPTTTVFLQKAAEVNTIDRDRLGALVMKLFKSLFMISLAGLLVFIVISKWLFSFVFGSEWSMAGQYAGFIAVMMILNVPQQPIAVLYRLLSQEVYNFWINVVGLILRGTALFVGILLREPLAALALYALSSILISSVSLGVLFKFVGIPWRRLVPYLVVVLIILILFFWYGQP